MVSVVITKHAIERYIDRVRPAFSFKQAEQDILKILGAGTYTHQDEPPPWKPSEYAHVTSWLMLGDDVAFPIVDGKLVTCLTNAGLPPSMRVHRNSVARSRRRTRKFKENRPRPEGADD